MIIGCVIFYNDSPELLERCLKSLSKVTDKIISIDGPYAEFPHTEINSNSECIKIAKKYSDVFCLNDSEWPDQATKRNLYISEALKLVGETEDNYLLILDADEFVSGKKPTKLTEDNYKLKCSTNVDTNILETKICRLIKLSSGLRYDKKHNVLLNAEDKCVSYPSENVSEFNYLEITHTPELRSKERLAQDGEYLRNRQENQVHYDFDKVKKENTIETEVENLNPSITFIANGRYHGYDTDNSEINVKTGDTLTVSNKKAVQLLEDFPHLFTVKED